MTTARRPAGGPEAWRRALEAADSLLDALRGRLPRQSDEWLAYVLEQAAAALRASVMWAATTPVTPHADETVLRRCLVAADAARGDALVAAYCVAFATSAGAIDDSAAAELLASFAEVEREMDSLSRDFSRQLGFGPSERTSAAS